MLVLPRPRHTSAFLRPDRRPRAAWTAALGLTLLGVASCTGPGVDWQGRANLQLREYQAAFDTDAGTSFDRGVSQAEFVSMVRSYNALWLGDHHRDERLHQRQRELLRAVLATGAPCCLVLEAVGIEDQAILDDYLAGRSSMDRLVAVVRHRWPASWLGGGDVDSEHYRELLRMARASNTPVRAFEPTPRLPLAQRDPSIAAEVKATARAHQDHLLIVVVGQSHLLGLGRLPERTGLSSLLVGAVPPQRLLRAMPLRPTDDLLQSDTGLWFFCPTPLDSE